MSAEDEKQKGAAAWQAGNYEEAIRCFTSAIDASDTSEKDFLKALYSNRSAAYMKVQQYSAALIDSNKCVEIDCNWAKGYIRRGDALYALKKYTECYNAYNSALRITPSDTGIQQKCELAQKAIRDSTDSSGGSSFSNSTGSTSSYQNALVSYQPYLRIFLLVSAFLYFIPLGRSFNSTCYRLFAFTAIANYAMALWVAHGSPQFNMSYAQRVLLDPTAMYLFLCILLVSARPYLLAMMPILLIESAHTASYGYDLLSKKMPSILERVSSVVEKYLPQAMQRTPEEWNRLNSQTKWKHFNSKVLDMSAYCEVMQGLFLIFELLLPTRSIFLTILWWQYLQMRYMLDQGGTIKQTFRNLDARIMTLLSHRLCPSIILTGYGYIKQLLAKQVQPPTADQQQTSSGLSGMLRRCSIM